MFRYIELQSHGMFTFLFIQLHISLYNVLPEAFVVVYKHVSMTSFLALQKPTYPQSFMLIYGFLFELWVSNLNKEEFVKQTMSQQVSSPAFTKYNMPVLNVNKT